MTDPPRSRVRAGGSAASASPKRVMSTSGTVTRIAVDAGSGRQSKDNTDSWPN
ncbi:hypothetical protein [Mycobacterium tilburgii]|uniref:hypothetical protein n=1 Tax=Mycobacterium tilburgii TaxID=44467 RepID=UPI0021B25C7B|nr:hypothetical protein [Mycobacterium tilburgii]